MGMGVHHRAERALDVLRLAAHRAGGEVAQLLVGQGGAQLLRFRERRPVLSRPREPLKGFRTSRHFPSHPIMLVPLTEYHAGKGGAVVERVAPDPLPPAPSNSIVW